MPIVLRSNLTAHFLESALPFLEKTIQEQYDEYPKVYEGVMNVEEMPYGIVQHSQVSALSPAAEVAEGAEIPIDRYYQGYSTTFKSAKYGTMLAISRESIDHERPVSDIVSKNPRRLARSMAVTEETIAANVFNQGFTTNASDGVPLFSTAHPLLAPGAGTSSNRLAVDADLSITSLKDMITTFKAQRDTAGNRIMIRPAMLVVPSALEYTAYELVKSTFLPEGNNNNVNSIGPQGIYQLAPVCWEYLTDSDSHFLVAEKRDHNLYFFWDRQPELESSVEFKTEVALMKMTARMTAGSSDWRGVAGSPGA